MKQFFVLLILATFYFLHAASLSAHELKVHEVKVDELGFHPSAIKLTQGDIIQFEVTGKASHWPRAATPEAYPLFDATAPITPGKSWSLIFEKYGVWDCQDKLSPRYTCQITSMKDDDFGIQSTPAPLPTLTLKQHATRLFQSVRIWLTKTYFRLSPPAAEQQLQKLSVIEISKNAEALRYWMQIYDPKELLTKANEEARGNPSVCHQAAHALGREAYYVYGSKVFQVFEYVCASGFQHGAMEGLLRQKETTDVVKAISNLCKGFTTGFQNFTCWHGAGHGLMAYEEYNLPLTIATCKKLPDSFGQTSCLGGAFMENVITKEGFGAVVGHETQWLNYTDTMFPCDTIDQDRMVQIECYARQANWFLVLTGNDSQKTIDLCDKVPSDYQFACFVGIGRDAAWRVNLSASGIKDICELNTDPEHLKACVIGAENEIILEYGPILNTEAVDLCKILTAGAKKACYENMASQLSYVFADTSKQQQVCSSFESGYRPLCQ